MNEQRQARIAENESRFRAANELIRKAVDELHDGAASTPYGMMCECALTECRHMVEVDHDSYVRTRANPEWFVVMPNHIVAEIEVPVEQHDRFWIIAKQGVGADVARDLAPSGD